MKILITGSKGLIGKELVNKLSNDEIIQYDIGDKLEKDNYDMIIHCAAKCIIRETIKNPNQMMDNINITFNIMELARQCNCKKVILLSSNRLTPNLSNPYTVSKVFLEELGKAYKNCYDIDYLIIRPETIWGTNDNIVRVMPNWVSKSLKNENIIIYGDKDKELSPLYIDDFSKEFLKLLNIFDDIKNGEPYIITGEVRKALEIVNTIIDVANSKSEIIFKEAEKTQPQKIVLKHINEIRYSGNLVNDIKKYISDIK